jgi:type I restriction enzyme M protein
MPEQIHKEERTHKMADYPIFMAMVDRVGHDKRGNNLYKRDKEGNEILVPDKSEISLDETASGTLTAKTESKMKVRDDQTPIVAKTFKAWREKESLSW